MHILIIEDNLLKRQKVVDFLGENIRSTFSEAASFNTGLRLALAEKYDLIVLDMSMPTFDRTESAHGGRFRVLAGKEIVSRLARAGKLAPVVILTGYKDFSVDSQSMNIDEINSSLKMFGDSYRGYIMFDATNSVWKQQLLSIVQEIAA
ncbi:response regulator [Paraburkholderia domus]|uniref:Response regulatory domain-containing protein n=1 Tax=Paraburkholderia domus TaxID=2793075 RepID=A0A9N8NA70_9BURK|nr:response regulator [Paraburkholderia domus]MBK5170008.1 response regulator [Burkholderia sp. R-70211]CAE6968502.1 hypothetical protein R70211_07601 [Paraburkholderia domus]